jgi:hypothetical protein
MLWGNLRKFLAHPASMFDMTFLCIGVTCVDAFHVADCFQSMPMSTWQLGSMQLLF